MGITGGYFSAICRVCFKTFVGVNFEAGNATLKMFWSGVGAEHN